MNPRAIWRRPPAAKQLDMQSIMKTFLGKCWSPPAFVLPRYGLHDQSHYDQFPCYSCASFGFHAGRQHVLLPEWSIKSSVLHDSFISCQQMNTSPALLAEGKENDFMHNPRRMLLYALARATASSRTSDRRFFAIKRDFSPEESIGRHIGKRVPICLSLSLSAPSVYSA